MKRTFLAMALGLLVLNPVASRAADVILVDPSLLSAVSALDLINWKVGDKAEYNVSIAGFAGGKMVKEVSKDEGTAIWLKQDINLMIQKQLIETLISKADGKILKMLVNGQEQQIPEDKIEIISQDYGKVTVPAGTFDAIHIVAKSTQAKKIEVWANPRDTVMEGTIKQVIETNMFPMTMELTSFKRIP